MKRYLILIINVMVIFQIHGQSYTDKKGNVHLWGKIKVDDSTWKVMGEDREKDMKVKVTGVDGTVFKVEACD